MSEELTSSPSHLRRLEKGEFEYSCLLHPRSVGVHLEAKCRDCDQAFGFPLEQANWPTELVNKPVVDELGRGFYGVVYRTKHPRLENRSYAVKLIPIAAYAPEAEGGYGRSVESEVSLLTELQEAGIAPTINDRGTLDVQFGAHIVPCYFIEMEFVEGETLTRLIERSSPPLPREIGQIAFDLLEIVVQLQQRGMVHNDLHAGNLVISRRREHDARGGATIDKLIQVRVLDLGAGDKQARGDERLTDLQWVSHHILSLINAYETKAQSINPQERRACAQLRRVAEYFVGAVDHLHPTSPVDVQRLIVNVWTAARSAQIQPIQLESVSAHINAKSMPAYFAPELLHDPDGAWGQRLSSAGTSLVYGMRGCGKTMLLRSLEWPARLHPRVIRDRAESQDDVAARVGDESFLGLFVACGTLLRGLRPELVDAPLQRTFLAFARELLIDVEICELNQLGEVDYAALNDFTEIIARHVPWFSHTGSFIEVSSLESSVSQAQRQPSSGDLTSFTGQAAFEDLAQIAQRLVSIWRGKRILFMLDDLSRRILSQPDVELLLAELSLASQNFAFKVSTESANLRLRTSGGQLGQPGREYMQFNLGQEVYEKVVGRDGVKFIERILDRRLAVLRNPSSEPGSRVLLGTGRTFRQLAQDLKSGQEAVYYGLEAISGMCVGDISDILLLYQRLERAGEGKTSPLNSKLQHQTALALANEKLATINIQDDLLHKHVLAFTKASRRELLRSEYSRPRTFGGVHIELPVDDKDGLYDKIMQLVEGGVYVLTGANDRGKDGPGMEHVLQIKLAFRSLLGLPGRAPLGRRDRFEIQDPAELRAWLEEPDGKYLHFGELPDGEQSDTQSVPIVTGPSESVADQLAIPGLYENIPKLPSPRNNFTVRTLYSGPPNKLKIDWEHALLIGAIGFEERGEESWRRAVELGIKHAALLRYSTVGRREEILEALDSAGVRRTGYDVGSDSEIPNGLISQLHDLHASTPVIVDITSLNKVLIFRVIREILSNRGEVNIFYTEAADYYPPSQLLEPFSPETLSADPVALRALDDRMADGSGPFVTRSVEDAHDPAHPTFLVAPIPLKHSRVASIIRGIEVEMLAAIAPVASAAYDDRRTAAAEALADYYVNLCGGALYPLGALDHAGMFSLLEELHAEYSLGYGYNFEVALTGTKMYTVGTAMLASVTTLGAVYYSDRIGGHDEDHYTHGAARTIALRLRRERLFETEW